ncbi:MAG: AEC family transporter [Propionibacteriaceae bacterium]|nr:AEC family transporter [Propionibacteriaceae bacterium]
MQGAIGGISTIWVVIGVGWLIAHLGLVNQSGRRLMSVLAFTVGSPALLFSLMSTADLAHVFSRTVVVSILAVAAAGGLYLAVAVPLFRLSLGDGVIGFMTSCYTNAANFGLPVALALLHDGTWVAPIMLLQLAFIMPICLAILDAATARASGQRRSPWRYAALPFRNPLTLGILGGLAVNLLGVTVPDLVMRPIDMVGGIALPLMLMAFGVSLRLDPLPGRGPHRAPMWVGVVLKVAFHPLLAWLIGLALGLSGTDLYAVVVLAALPAAQNVYVTATRYDQGELLARDGVFWSTILSVASLLIIAALLG